MESAAGAMRIDNTLYYILKDHLGSASVMTDASGNIVGEQRYYPYGETRLTTGSMFTDKLFTGQREMAGLGIYHYGARFYSPKLGRFISADSIVPGASNPQAFNRYSYVLNNPLRYTDPTGHMVDPGGGGGGKKCTRNCGFIGFVSGKGGRIGDNTPTPTPTPTATPTSTPTSTQCILPSNCYATQISAQSTYSAYQCQKGASCIGAMPPTSTPTPTVTPRPTNELLQTAKDELLPSIPSILGKPSTILDPFYSQSIVNSVNEVAMYTKLVIGVAVTNGPGIGDYLYNAEVVKQVVNGWMRFTNNNIIIPPLPLPYLMNNPLLPPQYQFGPPQYQ